MVYGRGQICFYAKSAPTKAVIAPMVQKPAALTTPLLVPRPVEVDEGEVEVDVKLEARELAELMTEEREEREEESPELDDEECDEVSVDGNEDEPEGNEPLKVEVGGEVEVTGGILGMVVGLPKQTSEVPELIVMTGVSLPTPLASLSTITTLVPEAIVT